MKTAATGPAIVASTTAQVSTFMSPECPALGRRSRAAKLAFHNRLLSIVVVAQIPWSVRVTSPQAVRDTVETPIRQYVDLAGVYWPHLLPQGEKEEITPSTA